MNKSNPSHSIWKFAYKWAIWISLKSTHWIIWIVSLSKVPGQVDPHHDPCHPQYPYTRKHQRHRDPFCRLRLRLENYLLKNKNGRILRRTKFGSHLFIFIKDVQFLLWWTLSLHEIHVLQWHSLINQHWNKTCYVSCFWLILFWYIAFLFLQIRHLCGHNIEYLRSLKMFGMLILG